MSQGLKQTFSQEIGRWQMTTCEAVAHHIIKETQVLSHNGSDQSVGLEITFQLTRPSAGKEAR